ncbi:MAG: hypothetical protein WAV28_05110 [Sedimentisphaerales bacterium]
MNKDDLIKKLENLDLPEVELQSHQRRLKMALLNSGYWKGETTMSLLKKAVPVGGIVTIATIIVVFIFTFKGATPQASAQEIAQKSYKTVASLSQEQQGALKQEMHIDVLTILQEAQNAKDLRALTYDQVVSEYPENAKLIDSRNVKFLEFTNADGLKILLGLDQNNLPAFTLASYRNAQPPAGAPAGEPSLNEAPEGAPEKGLNEVTE